MRRHQDHINTYFRLFPEVAPATNKPKTLKQLSELMLGRQAEGSTIPAGYTYLGQFIAHDISRISDDGAETPTPALDLDSIYGDGFFDDSVLIDRLTGKMVIGKTTDDKEEDLPRDGGAIALITDARNDDNMLTAQMQVIWMKLHNLLWFRDPADPKVAFEDARKWTAAIFQHVVLHDFLKVICNDKVYEEVVVKNKPIAIDPQQGAQSLVPIEFSGAAFRFGHSMVGSNYELTPNREILLQQIFANTGRKGMGGNLKLAPQWVVDWLLFFFEGDGANFSFKIDPRIIENLAHFDGGKKSLPLRNLERGAELKLPSGQTAAGAFLALAKEKGSPLADQIQVFSTESHWAEAEYYEGAAKKEELALFKKDGLFDETPLWYYVMAENWLEMKDRRKSGNELGTMGSILIAETLRALTINSKIVGKDDLRQALTRLNLKQAPSMLEIIKLIAKSN